ncbi:MAG: tyrosine-type recombinase/integrase [Aristaeellaceae bacterium]
MTKTTTNIRQRKNGLWEGRYRLNGKQCAVYGQTKSEAKAKLAARMTEIEQGICIERTDLTLEEWGWEWLKTFKKSRVRHSTMDNYESDFRMHVVPYIGHIKLKDLTALHVQRTYAKGQKDGLSPKSIRNIHGLIHGMLDKAVRLDLIRKNVSEDCELPVVEKAEMHTLSDVELKQFLELAREDPYYLMYYVDFFTGLRESELIGLTWDCIDFEQGTIRVYRQFVRIASGPDKGKMMFTSLKNHKERTFHPAPSVMKALKQAKIKQAEQSLRAGSSWYNEYNMVFTRDNGMFVRFKTLYLHFKDLVARINRPEVRFHDIRHTYAMLSIQSDVDFKTLSMSLGHATVAFTLDTYGHVSTKMSRNAADKMEQLIGSL